MDYKGYEILELNEEETAHFYEEEKDKILLKENEYLGIKNKDGEIFDKFCFQDGVLRPVRFHKIESAYYGTIKPRNFQQALLFDMLQDKRTTIKIVTGRFGSGKTFAMISSALEAIQRGMFQKIVWVRNNIEVKNSAPLGALPGELFEKLLPYAMPIADHVGGIDGLDRLMKDERLEIQHLGFIRGRDIKNSIIISSEAENLTKEHIQLLIGRVGEGSNLWLDGDLKQTDKDVFEKSSGLKIAIERLQGQKLFGYVHLEKSERSETAQLADLLD